MNRAMIRTSVIAAVTAPLLLLSAGIASAAPTVTVEGNKDLTIVVTPQADENGLRECSFKIYDEADKRVAKEEASYKKGAPVEDITFGPYAAGTYTVNWECKDNNKSKFSDTVVVKLGGSASVSSVDDVLAPLRGFLAGLSSS
ncbi:hypothetical protein ABH922_001500 [Rhodococcus sp. 27YEA15]|uniref:hypothetical protein n=1 Tax=Rhodococcus sp. 27YEA15 TaxID=3156259 RepID=UPI003C7A1457